MADEPPSQSMEVKFLRAFLNSRNEEEFSENIKDALGYFSHRVGDIAGVEPSIPNVVPVETWDISRSDKHYWLPLSEVDGKKGRIYVYGPAVRDTIKSPRLGPFYIMSWELLIGTVLVSLADKSPEGHLGTLFGGAVASVSLVFDGIENELFAAEYLDKLQSTASTLLNETLQTTAEWADRTTSDFYLKAAYQFAFDSVSLWTSLAMKTATLGIVPEKTIAKHMVNFLMKDPEINVGLFHSKGIDMAKLIDCNRGKDLGEIAFQVTNAAILASSYPRPDDMDSWKMFR